MSWLNVQDTLLNIGVLAFIGWLVWLYVTPARIERETDDES